MLSRACSSCDLETNRTGGRIGRPSPRGLPEEPSDRPVHLRTSVGIGVDDAGRTTARKSTARNAKSASSRRLRVDEADGQKATAGGAHARRRHSLHQGHHRRPIASPSMGCVDAEVVERTTTTTTTTERRHRRRHRRVLLSSQVHRPEAEPSEKEQDCAVSRKSPKSASASARVRTPASSPDTNLKQGELEPSTPTPWSTKKSQVQKKTVPPARSRSRSRPRSRSRTTDLSSPSPVGTGGTGGSRSTRVGSISDIRIHSTSPLWGSSSPSPPSRGDRDRDRDRDDSPSPSASAKDAKPDVEAEAPPRSGRSWGEGKEKQKQRHHSNRPVPNVKVNVKVSTNSARASAPAAASSPRLVPPSSLGVLVSQAKTTPSPSGKKSLRPSFAATASPLHSRVLEVREKVSEEPHSHSHSHSSSLHAHKRDSLVPLPDDSATTLSPTSSLGSPLHIDPRKWMMRQRSSPSALLRPRMWRAPGSHQRTKQKYFEQALPRSGDGLVVESVDRSPSRRKRAFPLGRTRVRAGRGSGSGSGRASASSTPGSDVVVSDGETTGWHPPCRHNPTFGSTPMSPPRQSRGESFSTRPSGRSSLTGSDVAETIVEIKKTQGCWGRMCDFGKNAHPRSFRGRCWMLVQTHRRKLSFSLLFLFAATGVAGALASIFIPVFVSSASKFYILGLCIAGTAAVMNGTLFGLAMFLPRLFDIWVFLWAGYATAAFQASFYVTQNIQFTVVPLLAIPSIVQLLGFRSTHLIMRAVVVIGSLLATTVGSILFTLLFSTDTKSRIGNAMISVISLIFVFVTHGSSLFYGAQMSAQFRLFEKISFSLEDLDFRPLIRYVEKWRRYYGRTIIREFSRVISQLRQYKSFISPSLHGNFLRKLNQQELRSRLSRRSFARYATWCVAGDEQRAVGVPPTENDGDGFPGGFLGCGMQEKDFTMMCVCVDGHRQVIDALGEESYGVIMGGFIESLQRCVEDHKGVLQDVQHGCFIATWNCVAICRDHEVAATYAGYRFLRGPEQELRPILERVRISIISGSIFCGHIGSPYFRRFVFSESSLKKAKAIVEISRLHVRSPAVLLGESTRRAVKSRFACSQIEALTECSLLSEDSHRVFVVTRRVGFGADPRDDASTNSDGSIAAEELEPALSGEEKNWNSAWKMYMRGEFEECLAMLAKLKRSQRVVMLRRRAQEKRVLAVDLNCVHYSEA